MHRLMIVDDSNIIRNRIQRAYNEDYFRLVATAVNGQDAVNKFKLHKPNVITMDLTMPNMDGLECIEKIVAIDDSVRILVVSALSDKATALQALQYGARGFVCKPFSEEELMAALERLIAMGRKFKKV